MWEKGGGERESERESESESSNVYVIDDGGGVWVDDDGCVCVSLS